MNTRLQSIRALNDDARQRLTAGTANLSPGVMALGPAGVHRIIKAIASYDNFDPDDDRFEQHEAGTFDADGHTIFFKIDSLDLAEEGLSPDPADFEVTVRIINVMLTDEFGRQGCQSPVH